MRVAKKPALSLIQSGSFFIYKYNPVPRDAALICQKDLVRTESPKSQKSRVAAYNAEGFRRLSGDYSVGRPKLGRPGSVSLFPGRLAVHTCL